jgi:hypothetical protein
MKILLASALLLLSPLAAHAACSPTDFTITEFKPQVPGSGSSMRLRLAGELANHCTTASAAQIRIEAKDASGKVLQSKEGWPAGTSNIAPGETAKFDLGRLFRYQSDMDTYTVSIINVRTW